MNIKPIILNFFYNNPIINTFFINLFFTFDYLNSINDLENFFRNFSFVSLFIAMIYYWFQFGFKEPPFPQEKGKTKIKIGNIIIILANVSLAIQLLLRWKISGHFPLSNLYESLIFLSWSCTILYFIILNMLSSSSIPSLQGKEFNKELQKNIIGCIVSPVALLMNTYATFSLPYEMQQATPLVPALQSNWLMMHVTVMILSYASLIIGSLLAISFLILTFQSTGFFQSSFSFLEGTTDPLIKNLERNSFNITQISIPREGSISNNNNVDLINSNSTDIILNNNKKNYSKVNSRYKIFENLDNYSYRIIGIGFSFLTIGILSGAVWANEAWGSYWSWDPKETWAFLTWLVYAIYLHTRFTKKWQGQKPALIASIGFITVWICFLGVNLIGKGLHSYGFLS